MQSVQSPPRPDSYEVMAAAYAMASGLGDVERAAEAYTREPATALDALRHVCEETRRETLELAEAIWSIHQLLSTPESGFSTSLAPFEKMLEEMRESEEKLDRDMAQHQVIREIMMPLRRATAKTRAYVSDVVLLLRQMHPEQCQRIPSQAKPEALRALAESSAQLLDKRLG